MRPRLLALVLFLFALAQAAPGVWAGSAASPWIVTPLWLVAMCGFLGASFALFGLRRLQPRAELLAFSATLASAALLHFAGAMWWSAAYLLIGALLATLTRWWARCSHPEIHTRTLSTTSEMEVVDAPSIVERAGAALAYAFLAVTAALILVRPWHQSWGTTEAERAANVRNANGVESPRYPFTRAVSVAAPPEVVWSVMESYFRGAKVDGSAGAGATVSDPPRSLTIGDVLRFEVHSAGEGASRLLVHEKWTGESRGVAALPGGLRLLYLIEPTWFVSERRFLRELKELSESRARSG